MMVRLCLPSFISSVVVLFVYCILHSYVNDAFAREHKSVLCTCVWLQCLEE